MVGCGIAVARTVAALRSSIAGWRKTGGRVGLVPTMGALHRGHLALVQAAREQGCTRIIASVFVNPKQFGPREDFSAYPRNEAADLALLAQAGVDVVFAPGLDDIYPPGFVTTVHVGGPSEGLCGAHRAGHFDGVATVVTKLLLQTLPDAAFFGEKDYQQLTVVRRLVRDLDIPVEIAGVPTVRDRDGLALSSRNVYLSPTERRIAPGLYRVLCDTAAALPRRPDAVAAALREGIAALNAAGFRAEYLELRDAATLGPVTAVDRPARLLAAVHLGRTRLIDNVPVVRRPPT
ncbi:MAG: pantoate--beta-alanine ligase [Alphaproteobacteria bacterium]|nr:pantoate--beta-alanine ligase [Alphaproteobacteria bacterium]MBV9861747.1 pantoate--beta-alanine ligase [Alphaproteobacteria bacterium]